MTRGTRILAVFLPLESADAVDSLEQAMRPYAGEGNKTDGWVVLEWQWSPGVDVTPDAYIAREPHLARAPEAALPGGTRSREAPGRHQQGAPRAVRQNRNAPAPSETGCGSPRL